MTSGLRHADLRRLESEVLAVVAGVEIRRLPINASWIDWERNIDNTEPDNDEWRAHSAQCLEQATRADILLLYVDREDARHFGSLIEAGACLSGGGRVFLVSPHDWPFLRHHPRCRSFDTLTDAVAAVVAASAGDRARRAA